MSGVPVSTRTVSGSARPVGRRAGTASDEQGAPAPAAHEWSVPPQGDV